MEKIIIKSMNDRSIVGNYINNQSDTIVIMAHGFMNDKSSNGRFDRLAMDLSKQLIDSIAINFTGCGESDVSPITAKYQEEDLKATIEYISNKAYQKIILLGNSFGTLACMRNYSPKIDTMILLGALTHGMNYNWEEFFSPESIKSLKDKGYFYVGDNRKHWITFETLNDFKEIDQDRLIRQIKCPVLVVHGDHKDDLEELELLNHSKNAMKQLGSDSKLIVIHGAKHGYHKYWDRVMKIVEQWIINRK